jgi:hypothetical protein
VEISLTQGKVAQIDDEDWPLVAAFKWYAHHDQDGRWYAQTNAWSPSKRKRVTLAMHTVIAGAGPGDMVDHWDAEATLDNRRRNIRVCTNALNQQNTGPRGGASCFKGVSWNAEKGCWKVAFRCHGRFHFVGYFSDEQEAAKAYDVAILPLAGEFARLNFSMAA